MIPSLFSLEIAQSETGNSEDGPSLCTVKVSFKKPVLINVPVLVEVSSTPFTSGWYTDFTSFDLYKHLDTIIDGVLDSFNPKLGLDPPRLRVPENERTSNNGV